MNDIEYRNAYAEVLDIINHMEKDLYEKIPSSFINMLEKEMNKNYKVSIDYNLGINNQELLAETRGVLSLIYRNYICDPEERKRLEEIDKQEEKDNEAKIMEKYNAKGQNDLEERLKFINAVMPNNVEVSNDADTTLSEDMKEINEKDNTKVLVRISREKWYQKFLKIFGIEKKK